MNIHTPIYTGYLVLIWSIRFWNGSGFRRRHWNSSKCDWRWRTGTPYILLNTLLARPLNLGIDRVSHGSFVTISKSLNNSFSSISESKCTYQKFSTWLVHALLAGLTNPWVWFTVWKGFATILHCNTLFNNLKALQALLDFVTTLGQWLNSYQIYMLQNQMRLHFKNRTLGIS